LILDGIVEAFELLISFDSGVYNIILLSLILSISATLTAAVFSIFFGVLISISDFKLKNLVKRLTFTLMGIPPVVLGLIVLLFLIGPLDSLNLVFTKTAMFIAQTLLVIPIITGNIIISSEKTQNKVLETATTLGANKLDKIKLVIKEIKPFVFMSIVLGFSRAISEVGAVMLVGGNIKGDTRVMTTSIALTNSMGNFSASIAMGIVLLVIAFLIHTLASKFRGDIYDWN